MERALTRSRAPLAAVLLTTLLPLTACFDCDILEEAESLAVPAAEFCGYVEEGDDWAADFECIYVAIEEDQPAWIAFRSVPEEGLGLEGTHEGAIVHNSGGELWGLYRYASCREHGHAGPCIAALDAQATGNVNRDPDEERHPHGPARINVENGGDGVFDILCR